MSISQVLRRAAELIVDRQHKFACCAIYSEHNQPDLSIGIEAVSYYHSFAKNGWQHHTDDFYPNFMSSKRSQEHRALLLLLAAEVYDSEVPK